MCWHNVLRTPSSPPGRLGSESVRMVMLRPLPPVSAGRPRHWVKELIVGWGGGRVPGPSHRPSLTKPEGLICIHNFLMGPWLRAASKRGNEDRKTRVDIKLHDLGREGPFLEHHVPVRKVELTWKRATELREGKGKQWSSSPLSPRKLRMSSLAVHLRTQVQDACQSCH